MRLPLPLPARLRFLRALTACISLTVLAAVPCAQAAWTPVLPADFATIRLNDFKDDELELVPYLERFHQVANAVRETGPDRGFIDIHVWRRAADNQPHNARIMENVLSLSWFYTAERPWNPYRGDPAVRARLEAALDFIASIQAPDGAFSEYKPQDWNLAATGFMTKFLGESLERLSAPAAPPLSPAVLERAFATQRKAILCTLTRDDFYKHGTTFTNQYGNVWPAALAWLRLRPDDREIREHFERRLAQSRSDFQSPAGFFYEADGPDFNYTLGTHASNSRAAWHYLSRSPLADAFAAKERRWFDWLSYNLVAEPGADWFTVNHAIETRTFLPVYLPAQRAVYRRGTPFPAEVPLSVALSITAEEHAADRAAERRRLAADWPGVEPMKPDFWSYSPYVFLYLTKPAAFPPSAERESARAKLPYFASDDFNHVLRDPRRDAAYFYVRRPAYYAAFTSGRTTASPRQRYGLGLLWSPAGGALLQSTSNDDTLCWGIVPAGAPRPVEAKGFPATLSLSGQSLSMPDTGGRLPQGDLQFAYPLPSAGNKTVRFTPTGLEVAITLPGGFHEQIPLVLTAGEATHIEKDRVLVTGPRGDRLTLRFSGESVSASTTEHPSELPDRRVVRIELKAAGQLNYSLSPASP